MISCPTHAASVALALAAGNATAPAADVSTGLTRADGWLFWIGLALAAGHALYWLARDRRDPLARSAPRENSLPPEMALVPVMVFVMASWAGAPLLHRLAEGYSNRAAGLGAGNVGMAAAAIACLGMGWRYFDGGFAGFLFGDGRISRQAARTVAFLLMSFPVCGIILGVTEWAFREFVPDYPMPKHGVIEALRDPQEPPWAPVTLWLGAVIVAPIAEECFFRGIVQTVVANLWGRRWTAVLIAGVLFGLAHGVQWQAVPALTVLGIMLGYLYEREGALAGPILFHALFNLKTLTWELHGAGGP